MAFTVFSVSNETNGVLSLTLKKSCIHDTFFVSEHFYSLLWRLKLIEMLINKKVRTNLNPKTFVCVFF